MIFLLVDCQCWLRIAFDDIRGTSDCSEVSNEGFYQSLESIKIMYTDYIKFAFLLPYNLVVSEMVWF